MYDLISEEKVKKVVDTAEEALNKCFDMLIDIKRSSEAFGDAITNFQPTLATCLYEIMEFYCELNAEKNNIISQKGVFEQNTFKKAMADNAKYIKIVREVIKIGKSLGDAFAWIFYSNNRDELEQHFDHDSTGLFVSGIGGKGEVEFIKKCPSIDGLFVIYHSITDILRVGDFSLYAYGNGIVGIGELKTKREGNRLCISASISSKIDIKSPNEFASESPLDKKRIQLLKKDFPNLLRQIEVQERLLLVKKNENIANFHSMHEYDVLNSLSSDTPFSMSKDYSLLLYGIWSKYSRLFDVLNDDWDIDIPDAFADYATKIVKPDTSYNEVLMSEIDTTMLSTRIPIVWWSINDKLCKDIYFKKVLITTHFNPATIIQGLVEDGFQVVQMGQAKEIKLEKYIGDKRMEFGSLELFFDLISHSLMETKSALSMAENFFSKIEAGAFPLGSKVEMHFRLNG